MPVGFDFMFRHTYEAGLWTCNEYKRLYTLAAGLGWYEATPLAS
jgi:hypothetical protein